MTSKVTNVLAVIFIFYAICSSTVFSFADDTQNMVKSTVEAAVKPIIKKHNIPGVAVGIVINGDRYFFNYGISSKESGKPITQNTLFEVGSISKTFTATLATYAQAKGQLSLNDKVSKYLPSLEGSKFGDISLYHLGTHTSGGFPLQVPDDVKNNEQLMRYLKKWQPTYEPGTYRTYANPSIGMLGFITAKSMNGDFATLMEDRLFPALGLKSSYIHVPKAKMSDYAQGYTKKDTPARMTSAILSSEAYGVKTTASDLLQFVVANMNLVALDETIQKAITDTHMSYAKVGAMTQDLIWEHYSYPVELKALLEGNSYATIFEAIAVTQITPPCVPSEDVLYNKTGSTNGFGAYVAFIPGKKMGIVILANKNYPNEDRVTIAHQIFRQLSHPINRE